MGGARAIAGDAAGGDRAGDAGAPNFGTLAVGRLRAEYRVNPLGIDVERPRFDWLLSSALRAQAQSAYQILVASTPQALAADTGDLWDSGKVVSDATTQIPYQGALLLSRQTAWWKVRAWDKDDIASAWSEAAHWEKGLAAADWQATWLSAPTNRGLPGAQWIWFPEGEPASTAPAAERYFRKSFSVAAGVTIQSATCTISADDELELFVNGTAFGSYAHWQDLKVLSIAQALTVGSNVIAVRTVNDEVGPAGLIARVQISLSDGSKLDFSTDATWRSSSTGGAGWQQITFNDAGWSSAKLLAPYASGPWGSPVAASAGAYFRHEFAAGSIKRARIYATALGVYELWLNGTRVGKDYLAPGFTDYRKRVQVQTYDVSALIAPGQNVVGAILADGWFNGKYFVFGRGDYFGTGPNRLLVQLELELADGSRQVVASSASGPSAWKQGLGPITAADILDGETYDAREEQAGWASAGFDDSKWPLAHAETSLAKIPLVADVTDQIQKSQELQPLMLKEQSPGLFVYDMGQNMVGWVRLKLQGARGSRIQLRFAEVLDKSGAIYVKNLRSARATDTYLLRGGAEESYEPRFTSHGFRYVELSGDVAGLTKKPELATLTGIVVQSALTTTGSFSTSAPLLNQLQKNLVWGQRGNFLSVPTDCPQRDERQGWMGDAQVFVKTSTFNLDVASFFTKWMRDVSDGQTADGAFSEIAPNPDWNKGTPAWGDAGVIVPWTMYLAYGDRRILEEHYEAMLKWVEYIHQANPNLLWEQSTGSNYGDWLSINGDTDKAVLATSFFAHSASIVAKTAKLLGKAADAAKYAQLFSDIKSAYAVAYVSNDGKIKSETQTAYALALRFELLPEAQRAAAGKHLADDVVARGVLTTGFIGVAHLLPALSLAGRLDLAYQLLENEKYPSWLYSINKGATTIWERWDGIMANGDFQNEGMNSFNHYSFGSVGEWMYSSIAGIELDEAKPAYKHLIIRPQPGGGLSLASAKLDTMFGTVVSNWQIAAGQFTLDLTVPVNTTANVYLPSPANVREGGLPITAEPDGSYAVGSGVYQFTSASP